MSLDADGKAGVFRYDPNDQFANVPHKFTLGTWTNKIRKLGVF